MAALRLQEKNALTIDLVAFLKGKATPSETSQSKVLPKMP
jgi:hypothetical protein